MSKGSGTTVGYFVEARIRHGKVFFGDLPKVGNTILTESWKRIRFTHEHPTLGIKNDQYNAMARQEGVLTYAAARGLMAWIGSHHGEVEFRLVRVSMQWSYEITREAVSEAEDFGFEASRSVEFTPLEAHTEET